MGLIDQMKDINSMRQQAKQMQLVLAQEQIMGQSKDAMIRIVMDGNQEIKSVEVMDEVVGDRKRIASDIREALVDLNNGYKKVLSTKFGSMMGS